MWFSRIRLYTCRTGAIWNSPRNAIWFCMRVCAIVVEFVCVLLVIHLGGEERKNDSIRGPTLSVDWNFYDWIREISSFKSAPVLSARKAGRVHTGLSTVVSHIRYTFNTKCAVVAWCMAFLVQLWDSENRDLLLAESQFIFSLFIATIGWICLFNFCFYLFFFVCFFGLVDSSNLLCLMIYMEGSCFFGFLFCA